MRIFDDRTGTELHVDLEKCDSLDPCAYDHTCRIHKLAWFLKKAGLVPEQLPLEAQLPRCNAHMSAGPPWYASQCRLPQGHAGEHDCGTVEEAKRAWAAYHGYPDPGFTPRTRT